jgi:hypothetical protein
MATIGPLIAKAQPRISESPAHKQAQQSSTLAVRPFAADAREQAQTPGRPLGPSWDFGKISILPPERASRSKGMSRLSSMIQRKLAIGRTENPLEHEADRVADQVMRMPDPAPSIGAASLQISRKCAACEKEDEDEEKLQMKRAAAARLQTGEAPGIVHNVLRSPGQPLDDDSRAYFEPRFGHDFSGVRVHTDGRAAESAGSIGASAYTAGSNIAFAKGRYSAATSSGKRLLAHELTHVVQQRALSPSSASGGGGAALFQGDVGSDFYKQGYQDGVAGKEAQPVLGCDQHVIQVNRGSAQTVRRVATDGQVAESGSADPTTTQATQPDPAQSQGPMGEAAPQSSGSGGSSGSGDSGDKPDPSLPDCTAVMGGRTVDFWAAKIIGGQHTFMNFKLDASNYWLVEAGPVPDVPPYKKTGAWAKPGHWDTHGPRMTKTFGKENCTAIKDNVLDVTSKYDAAGVLYDPVNGPNSNSFMEQLTFKRNDLPRSFTDADVAWDYWDKPKGGQIHTRPF